MNKFLLLLLGGANAKIYFQENFANLDRWTEVADKAGQFGLATEDWGVDTEATRLKTLKDAKFYAISAKTDEALDNSDKPLVLQFAAKHEQKIDCGGGYIKLMAELDDPQNFNGESEYEIMFGPDICGATKRVHAILRHGSENLLINKEVRAPADEYTHFYTFVLNPDGTFEVQVDGKVKQKGSVKEFWDFELPKQIKDPDQSKPDDWIDDPMMDDPEDKKPEDWDVEEQIVDPEAEKPEDWDDEDDGEWEAPMIDNPDYKGEWAPKRIDNPDYKGAWEHPMIDNPEWKEVKDPQKRKPVNYLGFDLWQVKSGTLFSNIILADNIEDVKSAMWTEEQFEKEKTAKEDFLKAQADEEPEEDEDEEGDEDTDEAEDMDELDETEDVAAEEEGEDEEAVGHDEL